MEGYVKLYRSSMKDPLYMNESFTKWQAWCDLILSAYYVPAEFFIRGIKVKTKRGCVYKGTLELADRWRWSRGKVDRFLNYLVNDKRISIQKNNVVSCISILNYDKFQQNGTTNDTTNKAANDTPNRSTQKKDKKEKNILFPESQNDTGDDLLKKVIDELEELKERLDEQEKQKKPKKKEKKNKEPNPLITKGREVFESRYSDLFNDSYYWQAKDAVAMESLTKKIIFSRTQKNMSVENEDVIKALESLLLSISDEWILKNFSVTNVNSKYNEIVAQARAIRKNNYGNNNTSNQQAARTAGEEALADLLNEG